MDGGGAGGVDGVRTLLALVREGGPEVVEHAVGVADAVELALDDVRLGVERCSGVLLLVGVVPAQPLQQ